MPQHETTSNSVETVESMLNALNSYDVEAFLACYAASFVGSDVGFAGPTLGRAGMRKVIGEYLRAFPDLTVRQEKVVSQPGEIILFWSAGGTQLGSIMHIPPSGRKVEVRGVTRLMIDDGEITRGDTIWDVAGMLRAIGLLPDLMA